MGLLDAKLNLMRQFDEIHVSRFSGIAPYFEVQSSGAIGALMGVGLSANTDNATFEGDTGIASLRTLTSTAPNVMGSVGGFTAGSIPKITEIGTSGLTGLKMLTDGDDVSHSMRVPSNWDRSLPVRVYVNWATASTTTTDKMLWTFKHAAITPNVTALAAPATVLDTILVADDVIATQYALMRTAAGVINAGTLADLATHWSFLIEATTQTGNPLTDGLWLTGVEFEYTPKLSIHGMTQDEATAWQA